MKTKLNFLSHLFISKSKRKQIAGENLKIEIIKYFENLPQESISDDQKEVIEYLKNNPFSTYPYPFIKNYNADDIIINPDNSNGLKYVLLDGKRLYFKRGSSYRRIRRHFNSLLVDQDINSPHRYLTKNFNANHEDVIVDIGAADGNFTLSVIEKVKKAYIFESNKRWIKALEATFAPWKEKVEIINKYVSDKDNNSNMSIDKFFKSIPEINFIKIDAEGAEARIIKGGEKILLAQPKCKIVICTYHKKDDEITLSGLLKNMGFELEFSKGYMIFILEKKLKPPYLRRGLIRAHKMK